MVRIMPSINYLKENDLVIVKKSIYFCKTEKPLNFDLRNFVEIKEGTILLVVENSFGSTYNDRTTTFINEDKVYFSNNSFGAYIGNSGLVKNDCFEVLND